MRKATGRSRRGIPAPHDADRSRIRRCPICQWAVDQDHAEALDMDARVQAPAHPPAPPAAEGSDVDEDAAVLAFSLV
jgi:hypothetical protein